MMFHHQILNLHELFILLLALIHFMNNFMIIKMNPPYELNYHLINYSLKFKQMNFY